MIAVSFSSWGEWTEELVTDSEGSGAFPFPFVRRTILFHIVFSCLIFSGGPSPFRTHFYQIISVVVTFLLSR